jgi:hypothetical protein
VTEAQVPARIPTDKEVATWAAGYKKQYARDMAGPDYLFTAQERELHENTIKGADPRKPDHAACSVSRGKGFQARRNNRPATDNPHLDRTDEFYAWYQGWEQGKPKTRNLV